MKPKSDKQRRYELSRAGIALEQLITYLMDEHAQTKEQIELAVRLIVEREEQSA